MTDHFEIGERRVGPDEPPLVIAEAGINHEGELSKALAIVDSAAAAGADVVKFQTHIVAKEMIPTDMRPGKISEERLWDIIARCELDADEEAQVARRCAERGVIFLSTPFSREAADRLDALGVPAFKIGSGECNNLPLVEHVARLGKPILLSTGMNDLASVRETVAVIRRHDVPFALFHCTSLYPTPYEQVRLGALDELARAFPGVPLGLSDHSLGIWTALGAVALGASLVEKHFTVSRAWPGPDVPISLEPGELADLARGARAIWSARGGAKTVLAEEKPVIDFAYASVVAIAPIRAGDELSLANVWVKRPGTGALHARRLNDVLGRKALRDVSAETQLEPRDVEGLA